MHARAHTHARTRTHTHTHIMHTLPPLTPPPPLPSDVSFSLLLPTRHLVFLPSLSLCLSLLPICPWQRNKEPSKPGVEVKLLTVAIDIRRERESKSLQHCVLRYTGANYRFWGEIPVKYRYGYPYRYPALIKKFGLPPSASCLVRRNVKDERCLPLVLVSKECTSLFFFFFFFFFCCSLE